MFTRKLTLAALLTFAMFSQSQAAELSFDDIGLVWGDTFNGDEYAAEGVTFSTPDVRLAMGSTPLETSSPNSLGAHATVGADFSGVVQMDFDDGFYVTDLTFSIFNTPFQASAFDVDGNLLLTIVNDGNFTQFFDFSGLEVHSVTTSGTTYAIDDVIFGALIPAEADTTFSIVVIPDTQMYVEEHPEIFEAQVNWIVANRDAEDIIYVAHLGDLKDDLACNNNVVNAGSGEGRTEWGVVDETLAVLDTWNIPYGVVPGNHDFQPSGDDQCPTGSCTISEEMVGGELVVSMDCGDQRQLGTDDLSATPGAVTFNEVLGPWRFADPLSVGYQTTYGDPIGVGKTPMINDGNRRNLTNEDNFSLVEYGSVKFIIINLGYREDPNALASNEPSVCDSLGNAEIKWADNLLDEYPDRLGIVTSHAFMHENGIRADDIVGESDNDFNPYGQSVYSCLANNPNFLMMMSAHRPGEAWRRNVRSGMQPVHALLSDYQWLDYIAADDDINARSTYASVPTSQANFGDAGFMRIMRFDTATGLVNIETFAPAVTFEDTYTYDDNPGRHNGHRHETRADDLPSCYEPGYTLAADGLIEFTGRGLQQDSVSNLCFTFRGYRGIAGEVASVCPAPDPDACLARE